MIEALVILQASPEATRRDTAVRLREQFHVVSTLGTRLLVVQLRPDELETIRSREGVQAVVTDAEILDNVVDLSDAEVLFALGWTAKGKKSDRRPGAGRDWDTPGFVPPDKPHH